MKKTICSAILLLTVVACNVDSIPEYRLTSAYSAEQMAKQVIAALQNGSSQGYIGLFPTLKEFHQLMEENSDVYGESLVAAKQEFAATYNSQLIPAVKESFDRIFREGINVGIDWSAVRLERVDAPKINGRFAQGQISIVFIANEKKHRLILEKVLILNSRWKVSQFIRLV